MWCDVLIFIGNDDVVNCAEGNIFMASEEDLEAVFKKDIKKDIWIVG